MVYRAEQIRIGQKKETTFDEVPTAGTITGWANEVLSGFDSMEEVEWKMLHVRGADREPFQYVELKHTIEDSFRFAIQNPLWFARAFGTDVVTGASPFTHTINVKNTMPFPTSVLELNYLDSTNLSTYWRGVAADSFSVSGGEGDILEGTLSFKGARVTKNVGALSTITTDTVGPYKFAQGTLTYFGSVLARAVDFTWKINNNGKMLYVHDATVGAFPKEYIPGKVTYELETTVVPLDATFFDQLKSVSSTLACTLLYTRGGSDTLSIQNTNCVLKKAPHAVPEDLEVPVRLTLEPRNCTVVGVDSTSAAYV